MAVIVVIGVIVRYIIPIWKKGVQPYFKWFFKSIVRTAAKISTKRKLGFEDFLVLGVTLAKVLFLGWLKWG